MAKFIIQADCRGWKGDTDHKKDDVLELDERNAEGKERIHDLAANGRISPPQTDEQITEHKKAVAERAKAKADKK